MIVFNKILQFMLDMF